MKESLKNTSLYISNQKNQQQTVRQPAYLAYKHGLSYSFYEHFMTEIYMSGGNVALKNHSKEFSRNFLGPMYNLLRNPVVSFVTENNLPFGLLADKMAATH